MFRVSRFVDDVISGSAATLHFMYQYNMATRDVEEMSQFSPHVSPALNLKYHVSSSAIFCNVVMYACFFVVVVCLFFVMYACSFKVLACIFVPLLLF